MCFSLSVVRQPNESSQCSSCQVQSTNVWILRSDCEGSVSHICINCANQLCIALNWKHYDPDGHQIDPPPPPPKQTELTSLLIDLFNLRRLAESPKISVNFTETGEQIGEINFDDYLGVHIHQTGANCQYSTNACYGDNTPEKIISQIVENQTNHPFVLEFQLGNDDIHQKLESSTYVNLNPTLQTIKNRLDYYQDLADNIMTDITRIHHKYVDKVGRLQPHLMTDEDKKYLKDASIIHNDFIYLSQTDDQFIVNIKFSDHPLFAKLAQIPNIKWRITEIDMDYQDDTRVHQLTISALF